MQETTNYKLKKLELTDFADITELNSNADIVDAELKKHNNDIETIKNSYVTSFNGKTGAVILPIATKQDAETGVDDTKMMTPVRVKEAVNKFAPLKTVNGQQPDEYGNVNVEEYTHPNSGVSAGTYNTVTVNEQGHVTAGKNETYIKTVNGIVANDNGELYMDLNYLPLSGGTLTDFLTITKADKSDNPSILFVSNSGNNKQSIYCNEDSIGFWDIVKKSVATITANITGTSGNGLTYCELYSNEVAIGLMNGVEIRIGYKLANSTGGLLTFQKPFSSRCFYVIATHYIDDDHPNYIAAGNFTSTNFRVYYRGNSSRAGIIYFAIGGL